MSFESTLLGPLLKPLERMRVGERNRSRVEALIALVVNVAKMGLIHFQKGRLGVFEGLTGDPMNPLRAYKIVQMKWEGRPGIQYRIEQLNEIQLQDRTINEKGSLSEVINNLGLHEAPITREERLLILCHLIFVSRSLDDSGKTEPLRLRFRVGERWNRFLYPQDLNTIVRRAFTLLKEETAYWMGQPFAPSPYLNMRVTLEQILADESECLIKFFDPAGGGQKFMTHFIVENGKLVAQKESPEFVIDPILVFECESYISQHEIKNLHVERALLASCYRRSTLQIRRIYAHLGELA